MAEYVIIRDGEVGETWGTRKQAQDWVDAGNGSEDWGPTPEMPMGYQAPQEIIIAKVVSRKTQNQPTKPSKMWGKWNAVS